MRMYDAGFDATRYTASFSSFLATPDTKAAEDFTPLGWRYRSSNYDDASDSTAQVCLHCGFWLTTADSRECPAVGMLKRHADAQSEAILGNVVRAA